MSTPVTLRTALEEKDIPEIVHYHDRYYAENYGFNHDFGKYVEGPLLDFFHRRSENEGIWLLDDNHQLKGCVALVCNTPEEAQLRWFYVDESLRGMGYGQLLISNLIGFACEHGYRRIILWTVSLLTAARGVYEKNGFRLEEEKHSVIWGQELLEQKFVKHLP